MIINILWFVCSLPVITIGPATCAAYDVMLKTARDEPVATVSGFFKAFRSNFKQALFLGLFALVAAVVITGDILFALSLSGNMKTFYLIFSGVMAALFLIIFVYAFALQARFENTFVKHIVNAFKLAFIAPGKTVLMWLIWAVIPASFLLLPGTVVVYIGWFYILFAVSLPMYYCSKILRNLFDTLIGETTDES